VIIETNQTIFIRFVPAPDVTAVTSECDDVRAYRHVGVLAVISHRCGRPASACCLTIKRTNGKVRDPLQSEKVILRTIFENLALSYQHSAFSQNCLRPSADWDWVWDWDWVTQASRLGHAWDTQASRLGHPWVELN
jgi:hypothetical protein